MDAAGVVTAYWTAIDARDWDGLRATLADDVVYEVPQSRERAVGPDAVVRFNAEYPGDWNLSVTRLVAGADEAATTIRFVDPDQPDQTGLAFFTLVDGRIAHIADWWPEPYDAPPGREHLLERY